jgi:heat shock 70kDa protein 1/2/6/8
MIEIDNLMEDVDVSIKLTREVFDTLNAPLFKRCIDTVLSVLKDANVPMAAVSDCVLVGGSTRLLALQEQLRALFVAAGSGVDLCKTINPDEAVAVGAAVQGRILATGGMGGGTDLVPGSCSDLLLLDVTPLSLGIELEGRVMSTLIKRNTAIPCRKTRTYSTVVDYQTEVNVVIYEGERPVNKMNIYIHNIYVVHEQNTLIF